jgi:hypothetical protein
MSQQPLHCRQYARSRLNDKQNAEDFVRDAAAVRWDALQNINFMRRQKSFKQFFVIHKKWQYLQVPEVGSFSAVMLSEIRHMNKIGGKQGKLRFRHCEEKGRVPGGSSRGPDDSF